VFLLDLDKEGIKIAIVIKQNRLTKLHKLKITGLWKYALECQVL